MNEPVLRSERLSALVDDETDSFETRRLLDDLLKSEEDRETWARYHLIGDCLRGRMPRIADGEFLARVQLGIASETPLQVEGPPVHSVHSPPWLKPLVGVGVAATVAAVSLLAIQALVPSGVPESVAEIPLDPATVVREVSVTDLPDPRFARYLENHAELLAPGSSAFARVRNSLDGE